MSPDAPKLQRFEFPGLEARVFYNAESPLEKGSPATLAFVHVHGWGGGAGVAKEEIPLIKALRAAVKSDDVPPYVISPLFPRRAILTRNKEQVDGRAIWNDSWRGTLADAVAPNDDWRGCGDADTDGPDKTALDVSPAAVAQGKNRYERFLNFKEYLKQFPTWEKQVSFHTFKGMRHQNAVAHSSPALIAFIVGQP